LSFFKFDIPNKYFIILLSSKELIRVKNLIAPNRNFIEVKKERIGNLDKRAEKQKTGKKPEEV
jgi:hypothetical protein